MIAERLKTLRKNMGITQEKLAIDIGVERSSIGKYEGNQRVIPSVDVLSIIADYFNVSTDYLLGKTDNEKPSLEPEPLLTPEQQAVLDEAKNLSVEQLNIVLDLIDSLKRRRNQPDKGGN